MVGDDDVIELDYGEFMELNQYIRTALRPVSREQVEKVWSPCNFCAGAKYITGGVTAVYPVSETRQQETLAEGDFDFCPVCGRPLTDEAVEMVMERLEARSDIVTIKAKYKRWCEEFDAQNGHLLDISSPEGEEDT